MQDDPDFDAAKAIDFPRQEQQFVHSVWLGARTLLGAPGLTTSNKTLLGAPGIATRSKDATRGSWPYC